MTWLEIIEIRAVASNLEFLESQLKNLICALKQETTLRSVKVYHHVALESDFSIHLFHNSQKTDTKCSSICSQIVPSLKDFGLVNHTVWIEKSGDTY